MLELRRRWKAVLAAGIALIVLGVLAIGAPIVSTLAIEVLFGVLFLLAGIVHLLYAIRSRGWGQFGLHALGTILYVAAGALLLHYPLQGEITLTLIIAVLFLIEGILKVIFSLQSRDLPAWGWLLFSGLVAALLGALIWAHWPSDSIWVVGLLVGINFLFGGFSLVMLALGGRRGTPATV